MLRIEGKRVVLRDWAAADLAPYRGWLRPEHEWHHWDAPYYAAADGAEIDAMLARLAGQIGAGDWPTPRSRLVVADPSTDSYLGVVTWYWESEPSDWRRVGVVLHDPQTWSGGRGTEALTLWTTYLFASTAAVRLDFATWSGNERMCRLGQRLGWVAEARFRQAREVRGQRYDSVVYGVLREEWLTR
ncbi:MAG: GNAT family N-acetyltransferase [Geodermatophilaceae bacterium]